MIENIDIDKVIILYPILAATPIDASRGTLGWGNLSQTPSFFKFKFKKKNILVPPPPPIPK